MCPENKPEVAKDDRKLFLRTVDSAIIIISSNFVKCFKIMFAIDLPFLLDFIFQASNIQFLESVDQNLYLISCCCLLHFHHRRQRAKRASRWQSRVRKSSLSKQLSMNVHSWPWRLSIWDLKSLKSLLNSVWKVILGSFQGQINFKLTSKRPF